MLVLFHDEALSCHFTCSTQMLGHLRHFKVRLTFMECVGLFGKRSAVQALVDAESAGSVVDKYSEMSTAFGELLKQIHNELIECGPEDPVTIQV